MNDFCMPWIWYLFIDMQLFILTPFLFFFYNFNKFFGILIIVILFILS